MLTVRHFSSTQPPLFVDHVSQGMEERREERKRMKHKAKAEKKAEKAAAQVKVRSGAPKTQNARN